MPLTIQDQPVPLRQDEHGVMRVGDTRVTLDTVVYAFQQGATPEEIVQRYPSVTLAEVYQVVAYYLNRKDEVDEYLRLREAEAMKVREENERRFPSAGVRERLLARQKKASQRPGPGFYKDKLIFLEEDDEHIKDFDLGE